MCPAWEVHNMVRRCLKMRGGVRAHTKGLVPCLALLTVSRAGCPPPPPPLADLCAQLTWELCTPFLAQSNPHLGPLRVIQESWAPEQSWFYQWAQSPWQQP